MNHSRKKRQHQDSDAIDLTQDVCPAGCACCCTEWECLRCTLLNPIAISFCAACHNEYQPLKKLRASECSGRWSCSVCTLHNLASAIACSACLQPRSTTAA